MQSINPNDLTERENYKFLIGSIVPRPIAFVTSVNEDGVVNGAPFSFFNIVSSNPPLISVSVQRKKGQMKDTSRNITKSGEFVVHVVSEPFVEQINETAANLPSNQSEIAHSNMTLLESEKISVPGVAEAKVRFECVLEQHLALGGDENSAGCDLIIGKVVNYHIDEAIYKEGKVDLDGLGALSRLAGNDYAKVGDILTIERPL